MSSPFGPSGGVGGSAFNAPAPAANGPWKISEINGRSGSRIDQIEVVWTNPNNESQSSPDFGGDGGSAFEYAIQSGDYLTQIRGSVGDYDDSVRVFSLEFITQDGKVSSTFGKATSTTFSYQCPAGYQITGIYGRSGSGLDALGVYIDLIPT